MNLPDVRHSGCPEIELDENDQPDELDGDTEDGREEGEPVDEGSCSSPD